MITSHVWRPDPRPLAHQTGCAYMNCRRPRTEHQRAVAGRNRRGGEPR